MKNIYSILTIFLALVVCTSCNDEWEDDLVKDNRPEIPVTFPGATTNGFNPYYTVSRAGETITINIAIPESSPLQIKEVTKIVAGATGINAGTLSSGTNYLAAPIAVNGYEATFSTTVTEFNSKVAASAAIPGTIPASPIVERAFMILLTMEDDSEIIPVQVRIRVNP